MKRLPQIIAAVLATTSIGGCTSAKQRHAEQQELERSIRSTSNSDAIRDCSFMMKLRPDGLHDTPEAQAASLVIPKQGVSWVVFGNSGNYELYSCSQKTPRNEQAVTTPTPVEAKPTIGTPALVEMKAAPTQLPREAVTTAQPEPNVEGSEPAEKSARKIRVTNNPEAVKGCRFLKSFSEYQKVVRFQEVVVRAGGNLGYVVAANQDGDVIGESYSCPEGATP